MRPEGRVVYDDDRSLKSAAIRSFASSAKAESARSRGRSTRSCTAAPRSGPPILTSPAPRWRPARNEARAVNIIHHPGVVDIYEHGQLPDGIAVYLVMEYLEGRSPAHLEQEVLTWKAILLSQQLAPPATAHRDHPSHN